jgi:hypothetical protein
MANRRPYNILIDEAGTSGSPHEPVGVVVAVAFPGEMTEHAFTAVTAVHDMAPPRYRQGFVYHTSELLKEKGGAYSQGWPYEDRKRMVQAMMSIPLALRFVIVWAATWRTYPITETAEIPKSLITDADMRHLIGFASCVGIVNMFLTEKDATGVIVVEQSQKMTTRLNRVAWQLHDVPYPQRFTDVRSGVESEVELKVDRISEAPAFMAKAFPLLQIADACAFGIRRYLAGYADGQTYLQWITKDPAVRWDRQPDEHRKAGLVEWPGGPDPKVIEALSRRRLSGPVYG